MPEHLCHRPGHLRRTALRWEAQGEYTLQDAELAPWRRWHEGHRDGFDWLRPWLDTVRNATSTGRRIARVRMLTEPLTDPEIVERHRRWLDTAFAHAQPFRQYRDFPVFERGP